MHDDSNLIQDTVHKQSNRANMLTLRFQVITVVRLFYYNNIYNNNNNFDNDDDNNDNNTNTNNNSNICYRFLMP